MGESTVSISLFKGGIVPGNRTSAHEPYFGRTWNAVTWCNNRTTEIHIFIFFTKEN